MPACGKSTVVACAATRRKPSRISLTNLTQFSPCAVASMATERFIGLVIGFLVIPSPLFLVRRKDDEQENDDPKSEPEFVTHDLSPEVNEQTASP